jgi:hypothetical protein
MYYPLPVDYTKLTAKDSRFQAVLLTGFFFLVTIASLCFFSEVRAVACFFGLMTVVSGLITAVEHRRVRMESCIS